LKDILYTFCFIFYITQVDEADPENLNGTTNIAKYVDIVCPQIPKVAQILNKRHGQLFTRINSA